MVWTNDMLCSAMAKESTESKKKERTTNSKPVIGLLRNFNSLGYKMKLISLPSHKFQSFTAEKSISGKLKGF